jgi:hypothetical protein
MAEQYVLVDKPAGLRIAAHQGRRDQFVEHACFFRIGVAMPNLHHPAGDLHVTCVIKLAMRWSQQVAFLLNYGRFKQSASTFNVRIAGLLNFSQVSKILSST